MDIRLGEPLESMGVAPKPVSGGCCDLLCCRLPVAQKRVRGLGGVSWAGMEPTFPLDYRSSRGGRGMSGTTTHSKSRLAEDVEVSDPSKLPEAPLISVFMITYNQAPYIRE